MRDFIKRAGELGTCYITTGMAYDMRFDIDTVDVTDTELILGNLDDSEIRIPLNIEMKCSDEDVWEGNGICVRFEEK